MSEQKLGKADWPRGRRLAETRSTVTVVLYLKTLKGNLLR